MDSADLFKKKFSLLELLVEGATEAILKTLNEKGFQFNYRLFPMS